MGFPSDSGWEDEHEENFWVLRDLSCRDQARLSSQSVLTVFKAELDMKSYRRLARITRREMKYAVDYDSRIMERIRERIAKLQEAKTRFEQTIIKDDLKLGIQMEAMVQEMVTLLKQMDLYRDQMDAMRYGAKNVFLSPVMDFLVSLQ